MTLVERLKAAGIEVHLAGDSQIAYRAPKGVITPERLAWMKAHKADLIEELKGKAAASAYRRWFVREPGRAPKDVTVYPPATRAEIFRLYPDADNVEACRD